MGKNAMNSEIYNRDNNNIPSDVQCQELKIVPDSIRLQSPDVEACGRIVRILLCHRKCAGSEEFTKQAIHSLIKKLKHKPDQLDSLIAAITSDGADTSECVTIQRSLDGRLQVSGKKFFPHVLYARIWRWPTLNKSEVRSTAGCLNGFEAKCDYVCVNPYHYNRVATLEHELEDLIQGSFASSVIPDSKPLEGDSGMYTTMEVGGAMKSQEVNEFNNEVIHHHPDIQINGSSEKLNVNNTPHVQLQSTEQNVLHPHGFKEYTNVELGVSERLSTLPAPDYWCSISYFELDAQAGNTFKARSSWPSISVDGYVDPMVLNRFCVGILSNVRRTEQSVRTRLFIGKGVTLDLKGEGDVWLRCQSEYSVFVQSPYLDKQAGRSHGDTVHKIHPSAYVKVFDLRQCVQEIRELVTVAQAGAVNHAKAIAGHLPQNQSASNNITKAAAIGVDDLRRLCVLRLSFVKGWGKDYPRKSIKDTPCWIEASFHRALQLLDEILRTLPTTSSKF